jgi:ribosomal protein L16 Arg81 hydroxylase
MYTIADREIELLAALMKNTESQLLQKEVEKRKNQLMDFRNQRQTLKDSFDKAIKEKKELNITQKSKQNIKEDTRFQEMSNSNLHQNQK